jgi:cold shock CspA family protein
MALEVQGALKILVHSSEIRATERTHLHQGQTAIQEIPQTGQDHLEAQVFQI